MTTMTITSTSATTTTTRQQRCVPTTLLLGRSSNGCCCSGVDTFSSRSVTLSLWARKASAGSITHVIMLVQIKLLPLGSRPSCLAQLLHAPGWPNKAASQHVGAADNDNDDCLLCLLLSGLLIPLCHYYSKGECLQGFFMRYLQGLPCRTSSKAALSSSTCARSGKEHVTSVQK